MHLALVAPLVLEPDVAGILDAGVVELEVVVVLGRIDRHAVGQAFKHHAERRDCIRDLERRRIVECDVFQELLVGVNARPAVLGGVGGADQTGRDKPYGEHSSGHQALQGALGDHDRCSGLNARSVKRRRSPADRGPAFLCDQRRSATSAEATASAEVLRSDAAHLRGAVRRERLVQAHAAAGHAGHAAAGHAAHAATGHAAHAAAGHATHAAAAHAAHAAAAVAAHAIRTGAGLAGTADMRRRWRRRRLLALALRAQMAVRAARMAFARSPCCECRGSDASRG